MVLRAALATWRTGWVLSKTDYSCPSSALSRRAERDPVWPSLEQPGAPVDPYPQHDDPVRTRTRT